MQLVLADGPPLPLYVFSKMTAPRTIRPSFPDGTVVFVVLGMHRSGTSMVAGSLALCGVEFGRHLVPASPSNALGHWEHEGVVAIHDRLLAEFGLNWHDPDPLPAGWEDAPGAHAAEQQLERLLGAEFAQVPVWGVKDPRISRLLPLWHRLTARLGLSPRYLHVLRPAEDTAASLVRRNGLSLNHARSLWLAYQHDILHSTAGRHDLRRVSYETFLANPVDLCRELLTDAGATSLAGRIDARQITAFCRADLRHHQTGPRPDVWGQMYRQLQAPDSGIQDNLAIASTVLQHLAETNLAASRTRKQVIHLQTELARQAIEAAGQIHKVAQMQASLSWRITAPLRALRRILVDPLMPENWRADPRGLNYQAWLKAYEPPAQARCAGRLETLSPTARPLISILLPVPASSGPRLWRTLDSLRAQTYAVWELCLAPGPGMAPDVVARLAEEAARDPRIKIVPQKRAGSRADPVNAALAAAQGTFALLLDTDLELSPMALAEVALALENQPDLDLIYSDEDRIDQHGRRSAPFFKPDWDPDLLLGQDYVCRLGVFRTGRARAVGGWRDGFEGIDSWEFALRFTAGIDPARVRHLPLVLCHRHATAAAALSGGAGPGSRSSEAARRALADRLQQEHVTAELLPAPDGSWRIKRALPSPAPRVSIIIPTRNGVDLLRRCVTSLLERTDYPDYEITIVNHRSDEPATLAYLGELSARGIRVLPCDLAGFNYSAINNYAVRAIPAAPVLALLNNDLEVISRDWLAEMVAHAVRPEIGAVGAMLYYPNDTVQHAGVLLGIGGAAAHAFRRTPRGAAGHGRRLHCVQSYSAVTAACLVVRRAVFEQVGGFDGTNLPVSFNDVDFCLRVGAAGYRNLWTPFAELYHHESASRGREDTPEKRARAEREVSFLRAQWGQVMNHDPAYNPTLTLVHEDFRLAWPPRTPDTSAGRF